MIHLIGAARLPCWDSGMERCVNRCTRRLSFRGGAVAVRNGLHIIKPNSRLSDDLNAKTAVTMLRSSLCFGSSRGLFLGLKVRKEKALPRVPIYFFDLEGSVQRYAFDRMGDKPIR